MKTSINASRRGNETQNSQGFGERAARNFRSDNFVQGFFKDVFVLKGRRKLAGGKTAIADAAPGKGVPSTCALEGRWKPMASKSPSTPPGCEANRASVPGVSLTALPPANFLCSSRARQGGSIPLFHRNQVSKEEVRNSLPRLLRVKTGAVTAFTLLEVMIASALFFMAIFAILSLVTTNLRNARRLQQESVNAGLLIADYCQTNKLTEGSDSGDFGELYPGYRWDSETVLASSNGFFQVDYVVTKPGGGPGSVTKLTAFLYRPDSAPPH